MNALGDLYLKISGDMKPLKDALGKASAETKKWANDAESSISKVSRGFVNLKTAIGGALLAGAAVKGFNLMYEALSKLENLDEVSTKLGVTAEKLQELHYAAEMNGSSAEEMNAALEKLHLNIGLAHNGTGKLADVTERYGLSLRNADGSIKSTQQVFEDLVKLLGETKNANERAAIAAAAFGKEMGPNLLILLTQGKTTLEEFAQKARDLGLVLSDDLVKGAAEAKDKVDTLKMVLGAEFSRVVADNAEEIGKWSEKAIEAFRWVIQHSEDLIKIMKVVGGTMAVVFAAKTISAIYAAGKAVFEIVKAFRALAASQAVVAAMSGPAGWAMLAAGAAAAAAAVYGLNKMFEDTTESAAGLKEEMVDLDWSMGDSAETINSKYSAAIGELQQRFAAGKISAEELRKEIEKLNRERERGLMLTGGAGPLSDGAGDKAAEAAAAKEAAKAKAKAEEAALEERLAAIRAELASKTALLNEVEAIHYELMTDEEKASAKAAEQMWTLQKAYEAGVISLTRYNELMGEILSKQIETDLGKIEPPKIPEGAFEEYERMQKMMEGLKSTQDEFIDGFTDELAEALSGGKANFNDFAKSILKSIMKMIIQMMIFRALGGLAGSSNPSVAAFGQAMGGTAPTTTGKASGGAISGPTVVGERGKELFVPSAPGRILNNHQTNRVMGAAPNFKVEVVNRGSTPTKATQSNAKFDGKSWVVGIILEDLARGGPISNGMGQSYGLRRAVK